MPDDGVAEGTLTRAEIAELASLFDRFEFAFDPLAVAAKEAESAFEEKVLLLFHERVLPKYRSVTFGVFRAKIKTVCREYLRKNPS